MPVTRPSRTTGTRLIPVIDEHTRYLAELGILAHRDGRRRHHGARGVVLSVQPSYKLGGYRLAFGEHLQPRLAPGRVRGSLWTDQIALAHYPYGRSVIVDDRHCADVFVQQQPGDFTCRRVGMHRYNRLAHDITSIHWLLFLDLLALLIGEPSIVVTPSFS